jgi:hypothetical protein
MPRVQPRVISSRHASPAVSAVGGIYHTSPPPDAAILIFSLPPSLCVLGYAENTTSRKGSRYEEVDISFKCAYLLSIFDTAAPSQKGQAQMGGIYNGNKEHSHTY